MSKVIKILIIVVFPLYLVLCIYLYLVQEKMIFHPAPLPPDHVFGFEQDFQELYIDTDDNVKLHALLFTVKEPKGVILYLHGNKGNVDDYGKIAHHYTSLKHDILIFDYRGYGKSEGEINGEKLFYSDAQKVYERLKSLYAEKDITIIGYSIGTGTASRLAAKNNPRQLILKAPYYSAVDLGERKYPYIPVFLMKYRFMTHNFIKKVKAPVTIFHGTADETVYYGSALKLQKHFKPEDQLVTLEGFSHHDFETNTEYQSRIKALLD